MRATLIGSTMLAIVFAMPVAAADDAERHAEVVEVKGSATAVVAESPIALEPNLRLPPATSVSVAAESHAVLTFGEDCDIRLESGDWRVPDIAAATATDIEGGVQIFVDNSFVPIVPNQPVREKDRILVQQDSSAILRYEAGCDLKLDPGIHEVPDGCRCLAALMASSEPMVSPWVATPLFIGTGLWVVQEDGGELCVTPPCPCGTPPCEF